jgi:hypothetical protein
MIQNICGISVRPWNVGLEGCEICGSMGGRGEHRRLGYTGWPIRGTRVVHIASVDDDYFLDAASTEAMLRTDAKSIPDGRSWASNGRQPDASLPIAIDVNRAKQDESQSQGTCSYTWSYIDEVLDSGSSY